MAFQQPRILITAGPTREPIDPIRFISNYSTGRMGYEIAKESLKRGFPTTLLMGPTSLRPLRGMRWISFETVGDLKGQLERLLPHCDCLIMAAAVGDFQLSKANRKKLKRTSNLSLRLKSTPDLVRSLRGKYPDKLFIGFCLESSRMIENAKRKMRWKRLDYMVANSIRGDRNPFGDRRTSVAIIGKNGFNKFLKKVSKSKIADEILDLTERNFNRRGIMTRHASI